MIFDSWWEVHEFGSPESLELSRINRQCGQRLAVVIRRRFEIISSVQYPLVSSRLCVWHDLANTILGLDRHPISWWIFLLILTQGRDGEGRQT
mmetsp:Transcript_6956/g.21725  ORF Transcript_6956/g.21725 Transcript_6956/m.21725 type:complete len:93 (+) Transcript_6956:204-482(+)